ncbi:MAG: sigma-54-dependent Fis family transcriptional regulator, partial [Gemmatimonadetes bacterium]|nr:sigma-54-dependent Fis family transcriptional regulator [Gemmatimonadota bacterium]
MQTKTAPADVTGGVASALPPAAIRPEQRAKLRVAIVDDERALAESCATVLRLEGYDVTVWERGQDALDALSRRPFDIVLTDLYLPGVDGLALLRAALKSNPACLVVVMTGQPTVDSSFEALRQGAWDYLPKPFSAAHLQILVTRAAQTILVARETEALGAKGGADTAGRLALLGSSPQFRAALEMARKVAPTDASVFIT